MPISSWNALGSMQLSCSDCLPNCSGYFRGRECRQAQDRVPFDEAHLLFAEAPKPLMQEIERLVRLVRSKGVGVYFVTQSPADVPEAVLA